MNKPSSKRKLVKITIVMILLLLSLPIIYIIALPFYKAYAYKSIIDTATAELFNNHRNCILKEVSSSRHPLLPSRVSGYYEIYMSECAKPEYKLYKRLQIHMFWSPFSDLSEKYERMRTKGNNYLRAEFNTNCYYLLTPKTGISLNCYWETTEYMIHAHPIRNYTRDEKKIKNELREIHETIWKQLD